MSQQEIQTAAGGGLVKVTMNGRHVVKRIEIDPELLKDDPEMIEDLLAAAINDAVSQVDRLADEKINSTTANMGLPPGLSGLFGA